MNDEDDLGELGKKKFSELTEEEWEKLKKESGLSNSLSSMLKGMRPGSEVFDRIYDPFKSVKPQLPDFSALKQQFETPRISPILDNKPKREIPLGVEEEEAVKQALDYFESSSLYEAELLKLFEDWQSDRTKSIKKFLLSLVTVLSLTVVAGINILEVELFNIKVADGYQFLFLSAFTIVLGSLFYYYEVCLRRDKKVNDSNLKVFMDTLKQSNIYLVVIEKLLEKSGVSIEELVSDFDDSLPVAQSKRSPLRGYRMMKFFKTDLEEPYNTDLSIYRFEISGLYTLGLLSLLSIVRSMIWVNNSDANLFPFYAMGLGIVLASISFLQLRFKA